MRSNADDEPWSEAEEREHWDEVDSNENSANDGADAERSAEHERRAEQAEADAERGGEGDEPPACGDAAELDPQLERAEGEGMVTEHAKVSATDPGPEPVPEPEPEPEPEPDHGPEDDPEWEPEHEPD